nr:hypothetical protein [Tanacetum cinerariifolium]
YPAAGRQREGGAELGRLAADVRVPDFEVNPAYPGLLAGIKRAAGAELLHGRLTTGRLGFGKVAGGAPAGPGLHRGPVAAGAQKQLLQGRDFAFGQGQVVKHQPVEISRQVRLLRAHEKVPIVVFVLLHHRQRAGQGVGIEVVFFGVVGGVGVFEGLVQHAAVVVVAGDAPRQKEQEGKWPHHQATHQQYGPDDGFQPGRMPPAAQQAATRVEEGDQHAPAQRHGHGQTK